MAETKKQAERKAENPADLFDKEVREERDRVLEEDPAVAINRRAPESDNAELALADRLVNDQATTPAERASFSRRAVVTNHTLAGLPSDVHQALVASSQLRREEAMAFRDIQMLLLKYRDERHYGDPNLTPLPDDVRAHLEDELKELESAAKFDERARTLLEKYT